LFNILNNKIYFDEVTVLDLFAGTGSISFEFASRGCNAITAVDQHHGCVAYIQQVAQQLGFPVTTVKADAHSYIEKCKTPFNLIFADPPYNIENKKLKNFIGEVFKNNLVAPDGIAIVEHSKHNDVSGGPNFSESRKYGGSVFSFFVQP
ncbi:MAG: RsmD family RNA methyltransferase, partial [Marinirhabdus sp.]